MPIEEKNRLILSILMSLDESWLIQEFTNDNKCRQYFSHLKGSLIKSFECVITDGVRRQLVYPKSLIFFHVKWARVWFSLVTTTLKETIVFVVGWWILCLRLPKFDMVVTAMVWAAWFSSIIIELLLSCYIYVSTRA